MTRVEFSVVGLPAPQGSKRAFVNRHTGRAALVESSSRHKDWRALVALTAAEHRHLLGIPPEPLAGGLNLAAVFSFPRPASHYGAGKNARVLKPSAPQAVGTPDLSKLVRSIEDAMTGIVYRDDAQIQSYDGTRKVWVDRWLAPGVRICVSQLEARESLCAG